MRKRRKRNDLNLIIFLAFLAIVLFLLVIYLSSSKVLDKMEIPATLSIGDTAGFNVTKQLSFGMLAPGNTASREDIRIRNDYDFPIKVEFSVEGNITSFLVFEKVMHLEPGEEKFFKVHTITISDEPHGFYSGKMIVVFKKA